MGRANYHYRGIFQYVVSLLALYFPALKLGHNTDVLDGMMVIFAMVAINIAHPGLLLPTNHGSSYVMREKSADESTRTLA